MKAVLKKLIQLKESKKLHKEEWLERGVNPSEPSVVAEMRQIVNPFLSYLNGQIESGEEFEVNMIQYLTQIDHLLAMSVPIFKSNRSQMNLKLLILVIPLLLTSCLSPSDKAHSCKCDYDEKTTQIIEGVNNFPDLESAQKCDQKCPFKRLLVFFYDESDFSRKAIESIEANQVLINTINYNFAFVSLSTNENSSNLEILNKKFNNHTLPFFAVMTSSNDSLITSFSYIEGPGKIDSLLINTLF